MSSLFSSPSVNIPATNFKQQITQTLAGQQATAPGYFALNQQYSPQYTGLNLQNLNDVLFGTGGQPGEISQQIGANQALQAGNVQSIQQLGLPGYQALLASNPGLAQSLGYANQAGASLAGPNSLMGQLSSTAQQQLALGGSISPQEMDMLNQQNEAGFASRGMFNTSQSLVSDLLNQDQFTNARLGQRLGWAQGVQGLQNQTAGQLGSLAQTNAGVYNPYTNILGQSPLLGGSQTPLELMGTLNTQNLFNPNAGASAYAQNSANQANAGIANANLTAGLQAGLIGAAGSIASAYSDERLKKKKMKKVGETHEGIPVREWSYKGDKRVFVSPTAQDVEKVHPEAVITLPLTGHKIVDFSKVDAPFYEMTRKVA